MESSYQLSTMVDQHPSKRSRSGPSDHRGSGGSSSSARPAWGHFLHHKGVSLSALHDLMAGLVDPDLGRHRVQQESHTSFDQIREEMTLPRSAGGEPVVWELCNPNLLMSDIIADSTHLQGLFADALARHPCTREQPWKLILAWDEYVPGDKLNGRHSRKCMNLVFSFMELGAALSTDVVWFIPVTVRHSLINAVEGGWSAMLRQYLHLHMLSPGGLCQGGAAVEIQGQSMLIHATPIASCQMAMAIDLPGSGWVRAA